MKDSEFISMGYLYKRVADSSDCCPNADGVKDIYSVAGCISEDFADYIGLNRNNNYWIFNSLKDMEQLAAELDSSLEGCTPFFYKMYPVQWNNDRKAWEAFESEFGFNTDIEEPEKCVLEGFDVVSYSGKTSPECSPLSCNDIAEAVDVNEHCLFSTLAAAKEAIESGVFEHAESPPWRIVAVYSV